MLWNPLALSITFQQLFHYNIEYSYASRIRVLGSWMRAAEKRDEYFAEKRIGSV